MTSLTLDDLFYHLPETAIAKYPLAQRDKSKLLQFKRQSISHHVFEDLPDLLPENALLVFNNTKVIQARLYFNTGSGAKIEIFLLEPIHPIEMSLAMQSHATCVWQCMVGNAKRWKNNEALTLEFVLKNKSICLQAILEDKENQYVRFNWSGEVTFAPILELIGNMPIPPYLKREAEEKDKERYQTIFAKESGAVAAPTAALHFTDAVMHKLQRKGIQLLEVTLHVSAGTFAPLKHNNPQEHPMHKEFLSINKSVIEVISKHQGPIIPVGTTSMRTLESVYQFGRMLEEKNEPVFHVPKLFAYESSSELSRIDAVQNVSAFMGRNSLSTLNGSTEIMIMPGYSFGFCDALITNFHQPGSTLIMLVAALLGNAWKEIYAEALTNNYRFLSYGDSSLLWPESSQDVNV